MKRTISFTAGLVGLGFSICAAGDAQRFGGGISVTSINYSEPVSIKANFDDWETDAFKPGNQLYAKQVARAGVSYGNLEVGYSKHLYYYLNFSADTALLHYLERNRRLAQNKDRLNLYLNANNAEGEGVYLGYKLKWRNFEVGAKLTYLSLQDLYYGEASGVFDPAPSLANSTQISIDYAYPEDRLFERPVEPPEGNGVTLDLHLQYQWGEHYFAADIGEAASDLYWNTAPGSRVEGNLNDLSISEDAAVRFSHFRTRFHQRLPVHTEVQYRYTLLPQLSAGLEFQQLDDKRWGKLAAHWRFGENWVTSLKWAPADSVWGLRLQHPYLLLDLETDSADYKKSHYLKLLLGLRVEI